MKRAYEYNHELISNAEPVVLQEEEQTWENAFDVDSGNWQSVKLLWGSHVPGSYAPEIVLLSGIQSMYNMGYDVTEAEKLIPLALEARKKEKKAELYRLTSRVFRLLNEAKPISGHPYWNYRVYDRFEQYASAVTFCRYPAYDVKSDEFYRKIHAGWIAQIIGAAVGTAIEGYDSGHIKKAFGEIHGYVRKPNTYNDDITYEIAFLEAFSKKGYQVSSADIAEEWAALIPTGWSAEDIALKNIMLGVYPPESGYRSNPFREWIGAQMRGAICGMCAPADPSRAAGLAFRDGVVSHHNNGVLGEVFNAVMCSMAFCERSMKEIVRKAIGMIPKDSEYYAVVSSAWELCEKSGDYMSAWKVCEKKYEEYNWIHAYPNAAVEVIALYFCGDDFDTCLNMICMMGQDADCNAAQVMTLFGLSRGLGCIGRKWLDPIQDDLYSYIRGYEKTKITSIARKTADSVRSAQNCPERVPEK
jgi:ADP-ribosylglycohydrolase